MRFLCVLDGVGRLTTDAVTPAEGAEKASMQLPHCTSSEVNAMGWCWMFVVLCVLPCPREEDHLGEIAPLYNRRVGVINLLGVFGG